MRLAGSRWKIIKTKMGPIVVLIQPQVGMHTTLEFTQAKEIIKRGEDVARQQVSTLQRMLAPRPRIPLTQSN